MTASPKEKLRLDFSRLHIRYKNKAGKVVPGVTTVLKLAQNPEGLIRWAFECGKAGKDYARVRDDAGDLGKIAHGMVQADLLGMAVDPENLTPLMVKQATSALARWREWWTKEELTVVASEHEMVSETMQVGGTCDVVAQKPDGSLWLVDVKTTPRIYDEAELQAATYAEMWREETGTTIERVYIVRTGKGDEPGTSPEVREVHDRAVKVQAFAALAEARRKLQAAGIK